MADAYDALPVDPTLPSQFHDIRKQVNEFLDSKTPVAINNHDLTYREIFDIFLYGYHAHAKKIKRQKIEEWASEPITFGVIENEFVYTLAIILRAIFYIRDINTRALDELGRARQPAVGRVRRAAE
jgi:hypothetical protein